MLERKVVLVVDDAPANIHVVKGIVGPHYKLKVALNGEKALNIARKAPHPDLVLLDVMMPGMDGYEVCRRLKADPATRNIPVLFATAHTDEEGRARGLALGAVGYLSKPLDPDEVLAAIAGAFQQTT